MSRTLLPAVILAVLVAACSFNPVAATTGTWIMFDKVTTNGDTTTQFHFTLSGPLDGTVLPPIEVDLNGGGVPYDAGLDPGTYILQETVPSGWVLEYISCRPGVIQALVGSFAVMGFSPQGLGSSWTVDLPNHRVTIQLSAGEGVYCTFTDAPAPPVGGVVESFKTLTVVWPYVALVGLMAAAVAVVAVARKPEN